MKLSPEFKLGIISIMVIAIFISSTFFLGKIRFKEEGYKLRIKFNFIGDLKIGAPVIFAGGIRVGKVIDIQPAGDQVEVVIYLNEEFKIKPGNEILIYTMGLLGEKYVEINGYEGEGEYLKDGDLVTGVDPISLDAMSIKLAKLMKGVFGPTLTDDEVKRSFSQLFNNAGDLAYNLDMLVKENRPYLRSTIMNIKNAADSLEKNLVSVLEQVKKLTENISDISEENQKRINETIKNLESTTIRLRSAMKDLERSSNNLEDITRAVKRKQGTIGKLIYEAEVYDNLKKTSDNLAKFSEQIKKNPRTLLWK
ncbi:MAG: MCE family protein [Spirochaetes bacterium]|nr:MCE family protein [Spirochaetota bacterium]